MIVQAGDFADMVATTLQELGENKWTDLATDYQSTHILKRFIPDNKATLKAGYEIRFQVMTDTSGSAAHRGLGYTVTPNVVAVMDSGEVPWRRMNWTWAWEHDLIAMNRAPRRIVEFIKTQRIAALKAAAVEFEIKAWRAPALANTEDPYGIPYYVVKSNTMVTTNDGFNGSVPSGHSSVAGLSPTTYQRWKNYATQYTAVTFDDLVRKMRRAYAKTGFKPIVSGEPTYAKGSKGYQIFVNYATLAPFEELLRTQNENLGNDLASKDGLTTFRRTDVEWVVELDDDTTNPCYGLCLDDWDVVGLSDRWMVETTFNELPTQPTMGYTNTHCSYNYVCRNRRRQWVLATDTSMPA